jgi:hypothetical protein
LLRMESDTGAHHYTAVASRGGCRTNVPVGVEASGSGESFAAV